MCYLAIDIGNTLQKAAVFSKNGEMVDFKEAKLLTISDIETLCSTYAVSHTIVSNVAAMELEILPLLAARTTIVPFTATTPLPITLAYQTPQTLGLDRMAVAVAAHATFPNHPVLVIQAGSCLVMDLVTPTGTYLGGAISPGWSMRLNALHQLTHRLPLVEKRPTDLLIGTNTEESITCGVFHGMVDEINGAIARYKETFGELKILLTGGDKNDLHKSIKNTIFAAPNLVLYGLYKILIFNVER